MNILVFNCGSSSQGFSLYQVQPDGRPEKIASGKARNVATPTQAAGIITWKIGAESGKETCAFPTHRAAAEKILDILAAHQLPIDLVGHRFVNGGELLHHTARIDADVRAKLVKCLPLAPIHNPNSFSVVEVCEERLANVPQIVVLDTAFHSTLPDSATQFAIPRALVKEYGFRKYGFHGLSYQYVSARAAQLIGKPLDQLKLILCHLGTGGSSICAVRNGKSVDTCMGYSPIAGLVMSTRCGDLDPTVVIELFRHGYTADQVEHLLNYESGLLGLSDGYSSNLQEIIAAAEQGNADCKLAFEVYAYRLKRYIGEFLYILNGADALVFTDDVGENCWQLRQAVCTETDAMGVLLDEAKNQSAVNGAELCVSQPQSKTAIWVIPTNEEGVIVDEILNLVQSNPLP